GKISLTLEPLVIRRTGFSPVIRYSCFHSHSHTIHHQFTPWLHLIHDAPLPNQPKQAGGHRSGGVLEPRNIVGAELLDQWAVTHAFKDFFFSANLLVVITT